MGMNFFIEGEVMGIDGIIFEASFSFHEGIEGNKNN